MSFSDWIKKLGQHLSPSEVLHFASTIRNQHVHDKNSDWVLK